MLQNHAFVSILFFIFSVLLSFYFPSESCVQAMDSYEQNETIEAGEKNLFSALDFPQEKISAGVLNTARWLDSVFGDDRYFEEENKSYLRLRLSGFWEKDENFDLNMATKIKLSLPETENRLHLIIGGDLDDEEDTRNVHSEHISKQLEKSNEDNVFLGLQYTLLKTIKRNIKSGAGMRFRNGVPIFHVMTRYRYLKKLGLWQFRATERVRYFTMDGWESKTSFDLERPFSGKFFYRTTLDGLWFEDEHGFFYNIIFSLFQPIDNERSLVYDWINAFETYPEHKLKEVVLRARFRQRIYKKWLFLEIAPQIRCPGDSDYEINPGFTVMLESFFRE